jgi:hypothetical protein
VPSNNSDARPLKMPQSIRLILCFRGPAMAQTALKRTRPAKIVMADGFSRWCILAGSICVDHSPCPILRARRRCALSLSG